MNTTSATANDALLAAPSLLNIYFGIFLWIAGNCGCMGNVLVFGSKEFRKRAYGIYLLSETTSDFIYFNFVLATRVLQNGFQISVIKRINILCKLRQYCTDSCTQMSFTYFTWATIDRLLSVQRAASMYKLSTTHILFNL